MKLSRKSKNPVFKTGIPAVILMAISFLPCSCSLQQKPFLISSTCKAMAANGLDRCDFTATGGTGKTTWNLQQIPFRDEHKPSCGITIIENTNDKLTIQSSLVRCKATVFATRNRVTRKLAVRIDPDFSDADRDGFPDVAELNSQNDRDNFRAWMAAVAESQFVHASDEWDPSSRDCAGLARFSYREALRAHDSAALKKFKYLSKSGIPDVRKFNYPDVPVLGELLFRTRRGEFKTSDLTDGTFAPYADARALQEANTRFLSKNVADALPADILFFLHFDDVSMPYHTMIFLGAPRSAGEGASPAIVYHTGPVHGTSGRIKRITVDELMKFPDERWHPVPENDYFLGVYRFRILD